MSNLPENEAYSEIQIEQEAKSRPDDVVFLDRAITHALAYYRFMGLQVHRKLTAAMAIVSYRKVFIFDRLPLFKTTPEWKARRHKRRFMSC